MVAAPPPPKPPPARIVFARGRTGVSQIYSVRTDGGGLAQITFGPLGACEPRPSPDGRQVALVAGETMLGCGYLFPYPAAEVDVVNANGPGHTIGLAITNFDFYGRRQAAAWSPDGRRIGFGGGTGIMVYGGRRPRLITRGEDSDPVWSPGGHAVAFFRTPVGYGGLSTAQLLVLRGKTEATVGAADPNVAAAWSPDGRLLAFTTATATEIVNARDGVPSPVLPSRARAVAWSPDGSRLAVATDRGVEVVDLAGGATMVAPIALTSLVWRDALYGTDGTRVLRIALDGSVRVLFASADGDVVTDAAWWRPPPGTRFHRPEAPAVVVARTSATELETPFEIRGLAADGDSVAAILACGPGGQTSLHVVWTPGASDFVGPHVPYVCTTEADPLTDYVLALGGQRVASFSEYGGISFLAWKLMLGGTTLLAGNGPLFGFAGDNLRQPVGAFLAQRDDFIWARQDLCQNCAGDQPPGHVGDARTWIGAEHVYRLDGSRQTEILSAPGEHMPLALDAGRVVVRDHGTQLEVIALDGRQLLTVAPGLPVLQAALDGNDLVVLVTEGLRVYDATTGVLEHTWPVPNTSYRVICPSATCGFENDIGLVGTAAGRVAYLVDGKLLLIRLADGATTVVGDATYARLTDAGLFYAYKAAQLWIGHVRFIPAASLP